MPSEMIARWAERLAVDISQARHSILLTALSIHAPRRDDQSPLALLWRAMRQALAAGAELQIIMPAPCKQHPAAWQNAATAENIHKLGGQVHLLPPARLLHAKTVAIDDSIAWIGSGNWTAAAASHNHEIYARITGQEANARLREYWRRVLESP